MPRLTVSVTSVVMPDYLTTREVAELLRLKERKVYDLAASGKLACSKAMGKLLFPEDAVHAWIAEHGAVAGQTAAAAKPNVILGSHDPLLDWALRESGCGLATYFDGSLDGLERFSNGEGIASGCHVFEPESGDWNVNSVKAICGVAPAVLVQWSLRQRGLILSETAPDSVSSIADIKSLSVVPRQKQAGAQKLFEHLLSDAGLGPDDLDFCETARSETDAALAVQEGKADAAFGLASVVSSYKLRFLPLMEERFDLLVDRKAWFEPAWQTFWAFCQSERFENRAEELAGYDVSALGAVHYNSP